VLLIDADTLLAALPYEQSYNIRRDQRFYVRMNRLAPGTDDLYARMWIDGELKFEKQPDANQDSVQFIYNFRGAPGQDEVEL
jgi:hypothetical protein